VVHQNHPVFNIFEKILIDFGKFFCDSMAKGSFTLLIFFKNTRLLIVLGPEACLFMGYDIFLYGNRMKLFLL
jgi:hypothetical protein